MYKIIIINFDNDIEVNNIIQGSYQRNRFINLLIFTDKFTDFNLRR